MRFFNFFALVTRRSARPVSQCYVCGGDVRHLCVRCRHRPR